MPPPTGSHERNKSMTIRFAPSRRAGTTALTRILGPNDAVANANDNRDLAEPLIDESVEAALRHFANHGLAAAHVARENAEAALANDDPGSYEHWQDICRMFDRPMAEKLERKRSA